MHDKTSFSVVCPAYNSSGFITATLQAVINQTRLPDELFIIDDGSSDDTVSVARTFLKKYSPVPFTILEQHHLGPGAARNAGIRASKSQWIAFLDSDDIWYPKKLAYIEALTDQEKGSNFFCHNERLKNLDGSVTEVDYSKNYIPEQPLPEQLYRKNFFSTSAVVCSRSLLLQWNGFDETLSSAQDYELWLRMSPDVHPFFVHEILGDYVMRKGNISSSRFWRRVWNMIRIKIRHRNKVSMASFIYLTGLTIAYHFLVPVVAAIQRLARPSKNKMH